MRDERAHRISAGYIYWHEDATGDFTPEKIIVFGSTARGDRGPDSDLDLLVIKSGTYNPRTVAADIYTKLYGVGQAIDLIVVTPEQVREYGNSPYLVLYPALREGKVLYDASTASAQ